MASLAYAAASAVGDLNGMPLYFSVPEGPGEVLCHNVVLNGGRR